MIFVIKINIKIPKLTINSLISVIIGLEIFIVKFCNSLNVVLKNFCCSFSYKKRNSWLKTLFIKVEYSFDLKLKINL